jgi:hypothetical protein
MTSAKWIARVVALFVIAVSAMGLHAARITSAGGAITASSLIFFARE